MNQTIEQRLLKVSEVAIILGISRSFAYDLVKAGEIPYIRIRQSIRVDREDLDHYIQSNQVISNPGQGW